MTNTDQNYFNPTLQYTNPIYGMLNSQGQGLIPSMMRAFSGQPQQTPSLSELMQHYSALSGQIRGLIPSMMSAWSGQGNGLIPNMLRTFGVQGGLGGLANNVGQGVNELGQGIANSLSGLAGGPERANGPNGPAAPTNSNPMAGMFSGLFGSEGNT